MLRGRPRRFHTLATVSVAWKSLVNTSPNLWATIHTKLSKQFVQHALSQSRAAPLDLVVNLPDSDVALDQLS